MSARQPGRIGLGAWSMRCRIWVEPASARFQQVNLPREAKRVFGIDTLELYNNFLESLRPDYLDQIVRQGQEEDVCLHGMAVNVQHGDMCAKDESERRIAVAENMVYIPAAQRLGLTYFRVNTKGSRPPADGEVQRAIKSYRELTAVAWDRGIKIAIENHGGVSYTPKAVIEIIETVGTDRMGTLPDIGNFHEDPDAYDKIGMLAPYALAVHTKLNEFDAAGEATNISLKHMVNVMAKAGFRGPWSIETGDPAARNTNEAILKSKALMEKYLP